MEIVDNNGVCIIFDASLSKNTLFLARQVLSKLDFHFNSLDILKRTFSLCDNALAATDFVFFVVLLFLKSEEAFLATFALVFFLAIILFHI